MAEIEYAHVQPLLAKPHRQPSVDPGLPLPAESCLAGNHSQKVCRVFVDSGKRDLQAILDAAATGDRQVLLARVHSTKGALLMLGEQDVAAKCVALEALVRAEGVGAASVEIARFAVAMRKLLRRYARFV